MEKVRSFKKVDRSYHSTPDGWRLATFEEAKNGLETIKEQNLLNRWDRARLLDGWISGPGYDYEIGNEFRGCMGYMLLTQTQTSAENTSGVPYGADVKLSELGKEVALLLCVDDWNYEVVYWLLNSWSKSENMNLADVRGGNVPFIDATRFEEMNKDICRLARRLGDEEVAAREKARKTEYSDTDSVIEVLMGMISIGGGRYDCDEYFLPESVQAADVAEAFWSFVCHTFAGYVVEYRAWRSLRQEIRLMNAEGTSKKDLMIATSILLYLSDYRSDIIHEPLPHHCQGDCFGKIVSYAEEKAGGDPERFSEMLKHNAMWRCYDETGNYGVLNKLLFIVAKGKYTHIGGEKITAPVVDMLLKCGAQPAGCYAIGKYRKKTVLHNAAKRLSEDVSTQVAQALLGRCTDEQSRYEFVNAADERGMTALHRASQRGNASLCQLLVEFNASVNAQDQQGMTPLHYALEAEEGIDKVIDVFMKSRQVRESVDLKDNREYTPLDIAIDNEDYDSTAKLLSKSKEPEAYLSKVDQKQLLRYSLLVASPRIVEMLYEKEIKLPADNCDEDGKPALHLAAMRDDEDSAIDIIEIILSRVRRETPGQDENMVAECDRRGRTVLHEAAFNGHRMLCKILLDINPKLINMKDTDGRNPLYDAVTRKYSWVTRYMLDVFVEKDMPVEDLIDRSGLTPLHVAVSQGNFELVHVLLSSDKFKEKYLSRGDFLAQTALHKAAKRGDIDTVEILLKHGAHPLRERDCDGRTALHYAVQAETGDKQKLADALFKRCKSEEEKSLLLWASAAGLGTADQNLSSDNPLHEFLLQKKSENPEIHLLRMAAQVGNIEMTKELIIKGYQIGDISLSSDSEWSRGLNPASQANVTKVSKQIDMIKDQGNDKPAMLDSLGRLDYAQGLAALFLNPYIKPPIAVGISGTWGMGKSSLMFQTEHILLTAAAQMALFKSLKSPSSVLELPGIKSYKLSSKGKRKCENIYRQIKYGESINRNSNMEKIQEELDKVLNEYDLKYQHDLKYRKIFKSLAAMDSSDMFETNAPRPKADPSAEENVPAVLTVQYNAWKYRNDTEALAGMAVEITKELEGVMSQPQWLSTCWRNTWKKKKYTLWIEIFFPFLLALVLVGCLTCIVWVVLDSDKFKEWAKAKYAWPPAAIFILVWTLIKPVMGILKPVSTQLTQYISFPDHTDKLGYQDRVISDITFLKDEIGKKAYWVFIVLGWVFTTFTVLWRLITGSWAISLLSHHRNLEKSVDALKVPPASGSNLRIIVFVDDLDRCQESVILQVLSAINIVLSECEINVVIGMDKRLIQRAIMRNYGDAEANMSLKASQELADMYLQKIIQLPLDLPDPSDEESRRFLKGQLGVVENENKAPDPGDEESDERDSSSGDGEREASQVHLINMPATEIAETVTGSTNLPEPINIVTGSTNLPEPINTKFDRSSSRGGKNCLKFFKFTVRNILRGGVHAVQGLLKAKTETGSTNLPETVEPIETRRQAALPTDGDATNTSIEQNPSSSILVREMLFVRYSQGEENAFFYFQGLATGCRKLPREWKRLLNYHRLVWYIFSLSKEAKNVVGWQVQLITWIFVCWEWQENMNLVIERWKEISNLKTSESNEPSLLMIVEHLMEEYERDNQKRPAKSNEDEALLKQTNKEETESNNTDMDNKLDALEKSLAELKKEMKKFKEQVSRELKEMKELNKQVSDELKKDINEIKEHMVKKQDGKNEENMEKKKIKSHNLESWYRLKSTLERYDVPMDGIQAFQRFRFYCIAGYLPRPS